MTRTDETLGVYAHISRMYNSSINALVAIIFGLLAFYGIAFNPQFTQLTTTLTLIGLTIVVMEVYFYLRILLLGSWVEIIEKKLEINSITDEYKAELPWYLKPIEGLAWYKPVGGISLSRILLGLFIILLSIPYFKYFFIPEFIKFIHSSPLLLP